jgi:hypothetical protein
MFSECNTELPLLAICWGPIILLHIWLCCCYTCLSLLWTAIALRISALCLKVISVSLQPLLQKLPRLCDNILDTVCQRLCLQYSLTALSSLRWNLPGLMTLWHFSSQNLLHTSIVLWPIFLFYMRNHDFQKYHSTTGSSRPWLYGLPCAHDHCIAYLFHLWIILLWAD